MEDGARQRALWPGEDGPAARGAGAPGAIVHRDGRAEGLRGELSLAALRWNEAARGAGAHPRGRPEDALDGRALRRARRADEEPDAGRAARDRAALAHHGDLRHARCPGSGAASAAGAGDVGAARPHQGDRRRAPGPLRPAHLPLAGVRRQGRRNLVPGPGRGDQGAMKYLPILLCAVLWEGIVQLGLVSRDALPSLSDVLRAGWNLLREGDLWANGAASLYRGGAGLALAIVVGAVLGILMAWWRAVDAFVGPLVEALYPMPKSALIPVTVLWLGFGDGSKILLIFLGCMLPVTLAAYNGARSCEQQLVWSARSLGASRLRVLLDVVVPSALPELVNGIRTALALTFVLLVSSELIVARAGLGYLIGFLGEGGGYDAMFAVVLVVAFLGFFADRLYQRATRRVLAWRE